MRIDEPIPVNSPRLRGRLRHVPWVTSAAAVLIAGLLALAAGAIRWWGVCLPTSMDAAACTARRADGLGLDGFTVLPGDLRVAAVLLAVGMIASGALWCVPLLLAPAATWRLVAVGGLALGCSAQSIVDLWWQVGGSRLAPHVDVVSDLCWLTLALITFTPALQFTAAESIASRRRGGARLSILLVTIVVAGPVGVFGDMLAWRAAYNSHGYAPGEGLLRAALLLILGVVLLAMSHSRTPRTRPADEHPEFILAA